MTTPGGASLWETLDRAPSPRQRALFRFLTATLVDLVVLGLFAQYWDQVRVGSFTIMLLSAALLQLLLKVTIALEHRFAAFFSARPGGFAKFMRFFSAWVVLFGSKFAILEALTFAFGEGLHFAGPFHGIVTLIVVVVAMLVVEAAIVKFYRLMG